jgi:2,3-diketo-5-methylthio-1-phosphopentane phosphatase
MIERFGSPLSSGDLVLCDFDGTISAIDTGLLVARELGVERFDEIEQRWRRGEISSRECLRDQWALVDAEDADFRRTIDRLEVDPGFPDLVALARERGARFVILSDGLDFYIERTLERLGMRDLEFYANHAAVDGSHIEMQFPHGDRDCPDCGNCKMRWLLELRPGSARTIYIGDGYSDACASRYADLVFAKDDLARLCREREQPFVPFANLSEVARRLRNGTEGASQGDHPCRRSGCGSASSARG